MEQNVGIGSNAGPRGRGLRALRVEAWMLVLLIAALAPACTRSDPEAALRARMAGLASAIEAADPAAVQQFLAVDFIGNDGLDRNGARRLALGYRLRHRDIGLTVGPADVQMAPGHATVQCKVVLRGGSGGALPDNAGIYDVESGWRLESGEWMLVSARWRPAI